ncbi:hypothetical protein [Streptomyces sp. NPDC093600]|uniref:DUF7144 family membrane protein n=1 Tax=Streptomyces sp. NPDC093600 TaxID=3366047 RepID=UPI0037FBBBA3
MTDQRGPASQSRSVRDSGNGRAFATGLMVLAAVLMILGGIMAILQGIAAIANDDVFVNTRDYVFEFDLTVWGWIHLILGLITSLAGVALLKGSTWARIVGVALASLLVVANFMWLPYHPLWALALIAVDVLVIWALCTAPRSPVD